MSKCECGEERANRILEARRERKIEKSLAQAGSGEIERGTSR